MPHNASNNMEQAHHHDVERNGRDGDQKDERRTCSPLGMIKSSMKSVARWWSPDHFDQVPQAPPKPYFHTPTHAASSFLKTTRNKAMDRANEIL